MMLIELFAPRDVLGEQRRRDIAERLLAEVTAHDGTPQEILDAARALWHVIVHEPATWVPGDGAVDPICGMSVAMTGAITLEHDGATYAFCNAGCRDIFAEQLVGSGR